MSLFFLLLWGFFFWKTKGYFLFQVRVRSVRPLKYLRCVHLVCLTNNNKKRHPSHQDKHVKDNGRRWCHCRRTQEEFRFAFFFFVSFFLIFYTRMITFCSFPLFSSLFCSIFFLSASFFYLSLLVLFLSRLGEVFSHFSFLRFFNV